MSSLNRLHCFCCLCCNFVPSIIFTSAYWIGTLKWGILSLCMYVCMCVRDRDNQSKNQSHSHRSANQWKSGSSLCYDKWNNNLPNIYLYICMYLLTHIHVVYTVFISFAPKSTIFTKQNGFNLKGKFVFKQPCNWTKPLKLMKYSEIEVKTRIWLEQCCGCDAANRQCYIGWVRVFERDCLVGLFCSTVHNLKWCDVAIQFIQFWTLKIGSELKRKIDRWRESKRRKKLKLHFCPSM